MEKQRGEVGTGSGAFVSQSDRHIWLRCSRDKPRRHGWTRGRELDCSAESQILESEWLRTENVQKSPPTETPP